MQAIIPFVFIAFAVFAKAELKKKCLTDAECTQNTECCYRHEGPLIVSRRQLTFSTTTFKPHVYGGYCEKYKAAGDWCSPLRKMNGHCSCGPGMDCKFVPAVTAPPVDVPVSTTSSAKRGYAIFGPGDWLCVPKDN